MRAHGRLVGRIAATVAISGLLASVVPVPLTRAATTITVTTTADDVDTNPGDFMCVTAAGKCSLRAAIQTVDALGWGNKIVVPAGIYTLSQPFDANDGTGAMGDLDIVGSQTISGAGSGNTIIQAGATVDDAVDRVFDVRTNSAVVTFVGMTIQHGVGVSFGGGINVSATSVVVLDDVHLIGNRAQGGAGISGQGQLNVTNSVISGNVGLSAAGIDWAGNLNLGTSRVSGNTSTNPLASGAIRFRRVPSAQASTLVIDQSQISGNTAPVAAAVDIGEGNGDTSSAFIRNSTITGNHATDPGATVIRVTAPAQLAFESATVASNATAAVRPPTKATITAKNSLFSQNGTKSCLKPITSLGHNLDGGTSCGLTGAADLSSTNPLLAALASNGGPTRTMALASNSPAIDAGAGCPKVDQRGLSRPKDGDGDGIKTCDIGAYERKAVAVIATPSPSPTLPATAAPVATDAPTLEPTIAPSVAPTIGPTVEPSIQPTAEMPSSASPAPTPAPSASPTSGTSAGDSPTWLVLLLIVLVVAGLVIIGLRRRRPPAINP